MKLVFILLNLRLKSVVILDLTVPMPVSMLTTASVSACGRHTSLPEIIITPADVEEVEPVTCPTPPLLPDGYTPDGENNLSPVPKRRARSLRHLLTRSKKKSRRAEKKAAAEKAAAERVTERTGAARPTMIVPISVDLCPESASGRQMGRAAARAAAAAAARRTSHPAETSSQTRPFSMSMRAPAPAALEPDDLAIRLRAYTESGGPGRPEGGMAASGRRHHAYSATSVSADFQRYLAARVAELRERRRHGLPDDQVRDEFIREIGTMLRQMADQLREARLKQQVSLMTLLSRPL